MAYKRKGKRTSVPRPKKKKGSRKYFTGSYQA